MTLQDVYDYFAKHFPDAQLTKIPEDDPSEIICEIDPTSNHADYSIALAAISSSQAHKHILATEEYEVIHGAILLKIGDKIETLYEREKATIPPNTIHSATGVEDFAMVKVTSQPGWSPHDHLVMEE